jgi:hypothetical protein
MKGEKGFKFNLDCPILKKIISSEVNHASGWYSSGVVSNVVEVTEFFLSINDILSFS